MRICSNRPITKQAKLQIKGILPARAIPAPVPTMFPSAMPKSKNRPGYFLAKYSVMVDLLRSASKTTMSGFSLPSRTRASPKATRVAFAPIALALSQDFLNRPFSFLSIRRLAVPLPLAFHKGDSLAFDRLAEYQRGSSFGFLGLVQGPNNCGEIVPVDLQGVPVEGAPFIQQRFQIHDVFDGSAELDLVVVEQRAEIVEPKLRRGHRSFQYLSRLALAVA